MDAIAQGRLDRGTGLQGTEDVNGSDRCAGEIGGNIGGNNRKAKDLNVQHLARRLHRLQILPAVVPQAKFQALPGERLSDRIIMAIEMIADRRTYEIGAVGVKSLLNEKVDMAQVHIAEVDRDLLAF